MLHWTIRSRLTCLVVALLLLMLCVGLNGQRGISHTDAGLHSVLVSSKALRNHIESDMMHDALRADVLAALLATSDNDSKQASDDVKEHAQLFRTHIADNRALPLDRDLADALNAVGPTLESYISSAEDIVGVAHHDKRRANQVLPDFLRHFKELEGRLSDLSDKIEANAASTQSAAEHGVANTKLVDNLTMLFAALAGTTLAFFIVRSILAGMRRLSDAITPLAEGKLGRRIAIGTGDEFGRMLESVQSMDDKLSALVGNVRRTADALGTAAGEVSGSTDDLNKRTQEQAAALEETAASMQEMATTVKQNARSAHAAQELAVSARRNADQGGSVVQRAIDAMGEINSSSRRIADIISTIDEIAFQTNLLALNAAVEAARAGEQGQGFAVVASEVRSLAQRSAGAAKEIKQLIGDSVEKVKTGTALVDESGRTLAGMVDSIRKVTDIVAEIAGASEHQAGGIEQVNRAVVQIDDATQQNAALVEQSTASSKLMESHTRELLRQIGHFQTYADAATATPTTHSGNGRERAEPVQTVAYRRAG